MNLFRLYFALQTIKNLSSLIGKIIFALFYLLLSSYILYMIVYGVGDFFGKRIIYYPIDTLKYLYHYCLWWNENKSRVQFKHTFFLIVAFGIPLIIHFTWRYFKKKFVQKKLIKRQLQQLLKLKKKFPNKLPAFRKKVINPVNQQRTQQNPNKSNIKPKN